MENYTCTFSIYSNSLSDELITHLKEHSWTMKDLSILTDLVLSNDYR